MLSPLQTHPTPSSKGRATQRSRQPPRPPSAASSSCSTCARCVGCAGACFVLNVLLLPLQVVLVPVLCWFPDCSCICGGGSQSVQARPRTTYNVLATTSCCVLNFCPLIQDGASPSTVFLYPSIWTRSHAGFLCYILSIVQTCLNHSTPTLMPPLCPSLPLRPPPHRRASSTTWSGRSAAWQGTPPQQQLVAPGAGAARRRTQHSRRASSTTRA